MKKIFALLMLFFTGISFIGCVKIVPPSPNILNIFIDCGFESVSIDKKNNIPIEKIKKQAFYNELSKLKLTIQEEPLDDLPVICQVHFKVNNISKDYISFCGQDSEVAYAYLFFNGIRYSIEKNLDLFNNLITYLSNEEEILDTNDYYNVTITGSKDSLKEKLQSKYIAGTEVEIKTYVVTDVSLHVFLNDIEIPMSHYDSDYWGFKFIMPSEDINIYLTYDQFYGKDNYTFKDLYYWVNDLNSEIDKVSVETKIENQGNKYNFITVNYSNDSTDIENLLDIIEKPLTKINCKDDNMNSIYKIITFYKGNYQFSIEFVNNHLYWYDFSTSQHFVFTDSTYVLPNIINTSLSILKFKYDGLSSDIKKINDDSFIQRFTNIGLIEFIPYDDIIPVIDANYYIDSRYGKIELITETIFKLNNYYYKIVNGKEYWAYNQIRIS